MKYVQYVKAIWEEICKISFYSAASKSSGLHEDLRLNKNQLVFFHAFLTLYLLILKRKETQRCPKDSAQIKIFKKWKVPRRHRTTSNGCFCFLINHLNFFIVLIYLNLNEKGTVMLRLEHKTIGKDKTPWGFLYFFFKVWWLFSPLFKLPWVPEWFLLWPNPFGFFCGPVQEIPVISEACLGNINKSFMAWNLTASTLFFLFGIGEGLIGLCRPQPSYLPFTKNWHSFKLSSTVLEFLW